MVVVLTCLSVDTDFYHQSITNDFADRRGGRGREKEWEADKSLHLDRIKKDQYRPTPGPYRMLTEGLSVLLV